MNSFEDIIAAFGGPAKFAAAIGIKPFHAQTMKTRGSIPPTYWSRVVAAAAERAEAEPAFRVVTLDLLTQLHERKAAVRAHPSEMRAAQ